jgi:uncharacterized protein YbjT (DUF2867 family)
LTFYSRAPKFRDVAPDDVAALLVAILAWLLRWKLVAEQIDVPLNLFQTIVCDVAHRNEVVPIPGTTGSLKEVLENLGDLQSPLLVKDGTSGTLRRHECNEPNLRDVLR